MEWIKPIHGKISKAPVSLFSIMRNEMYFLPAFLDHYRKLGVDQFLVLDDCSDDGSTDYLATQSDCVLLQSPLRFGEKIRLDRGWLRKPVQMRAEIWMKQVIPEVFLSNQWHIYVDADEFMILPQRVCDLKALTRVLDKSGEVAVAGAMVEFYPDTIADMRTDERPDRFEQLIQKNPFFDKGPLISVTSNGSISKHKPSTSGRLFARHGLNTLPTQEQLRAEGETVISEGKVNWSVGGAVHKVPLFKASRRDKRMGSHNVSARLCTDLTLPLCHFKFTGDAFRRMQEAIASGAWNKGSQKYQRYVRLLQAMESGNETFRDEQSVHFESVGDLERAEHLVCGPRILANLAAYAG